MKNKKKLTKKQEKILIFIKKYIAKNEYPPTIREIAKGINLSSPATVHTHLKKLIDKEYIRRNTTNNRIIELLVPNEFEQKITDTINIPLISNTFSNQNITIPKTLAQDKDLIAFLIDEQNIFTSNIEKNDIIIIEKTTTLIEDNFLLIKLKDTLLIRKIKKDNQSYKISINNIEETILENNLTIIGKPISLYRKF